MTRYGRLCTEFYDLDKPEAPPDALAFYRDFARRAQGPLLEPMCGSGRFLLPLLAEGYEIEGADLSLDMLTACEARAHAAGLAPVLHHQGIEGLEFPGRFGLIFIPSGSFCLLTDDASADRSLARVHAALLPGGTFVVEVECIPSSPPQTGVWGGRWVARPGGGKILLGWLSEYSGVQQILRSVHRYELVRDGELLATEYEDFDVRFYDPAEFRAKLERAGFSNIEAWKPYERSPPDDDDDAIVFSCTK